MKEDLKGEIWKDIPDYEGLYQISDRGRVYSLPKGGTGGHNGKILKQGCHKLGYLFVNLSKDGKIKNFKLHQLVAMAFLDHIPCGHKIVVDHKNENKTDNRLENLQLISQRDNCKRVQEGRYSSNFKGVCYFKKQNKWKSDIKINEKRIHLGSFTDEQQAAKAYQLALTNIDKYDGNNKNFRNLIKNLVN